MQDTYRTLESEATATLKEDGSRFLAEALRVAHRREVEAETETIREREH